MNGSDLNAMIEEKRTSLPPVPPKPPCSETWRPTQRHAPEKLDKLTSKLLHGCKELPEQSFDEREFRRERQLAAERAENWQKFAEPLGPRYLACRFSNFAIQDGPHAASQREVSQELRKYAEDLPDRVEAGQSVLLFGPSGTGKDHLLTALSHAAIVKHGFRVRWINGVDFYRQIRDRMDGKEAEQELVNRYSWPTILYFSDPLPPSGELTAFQSACLFSVIDRRYRDRLPTWVSLNVSDAAEAERRLGVSIVDRLRDQTLALRCAWPSHRKVSQ